jgi:hypothetical protein
MTTSTQRFVVTIRANGSKQTKRFASFDEAKACADGWRKAGARTRVERRVFDLPKPNLDGMAADFAGPDAKWGGWLTSETNEALDTLDLLTNADLFDAYVEAFYRKALVRSAS